MGHLTYMGMYVVHAPLSRTEAHGQILVQGRLRNVAQFT